MSVTNDSSSSIYSSTDYQRAHLLLILRAKDVRVCTCLGQVVQQPFSSKDSFALWDLRNSDTFSGMEDNRAPVFWFLLVAIAIANTTTEKTIVSVACPGLCHVIPAAAAASAGDDGDDDHTVSSMTPRTQMLSISMVAGTVCACCPPTRETQTHTHCPCRRSQRTRWFKR